MYVVGKCIELGQKNRNTIWIILYHNLRSNDCDNLTL